MKSDTIIPSNGDPLESAEFFTVLKLEDPAGKQLARSDHMDQAGARIIYTPTFSGTYRLLVGSHWGIDAGGAYTLRVRECAK